MKPSTLVPLFCIHLAILFGAAGCINSPLLNHAAAREASNEPQKNLSCSDLKLPNAEAGENSACPLFFPNAGLCASLTWEKKQSENEKGSFVIRFWDEKAGNASGPYVEPNDTVFVELLMISMGHGTYPLPITSPALDCENKAIPGVYRTKNVYFMMPGEWKVFVQLKHGNMILESSSLSHTQ